MKNFWKNKKVLITGHSGFKGTWLTLMLSKLGANIYGYSNYKSNFAKGYKINLPYQINERIDDILNLKSLKNFLIKSKPHIIIHMAAQPIVSLSFYKPKETILVNTLGTLNILDFASEIKSLKSIIVVTTDKVYSSNSKKFIESDPLGGDDTYSASKAAAELITNSYKSIYNFRNKKIALATVRAGNVIGGGDWTSNRLIPDCIKSWSKKRFVKIRNLHSTRPWQHVLEAVYGYMLLSSKLKKNTNLNGQAFNFGPKNKSNYSVNSVLLHAKKKWNNAKWIHKKNPKSFGESSLLKLNSNKVKKALGWECVLNFSETIGLTINWYKNFYNKNYRSVEDLSIKDLEYYKKKAKIL